MLSSLFPFRLNQDQFAKLSDICADAGQVFLASVVLPSFGFGGSSHVGTLVLGVGVTIALFFLALSLPRSYNALHES